MTPITRRCLGVFAFLAVILFLTTGAGSSTPSAAAQQTPANGAAQQAQTTAPANPGQNPPEMSMGRCLAMMRKMGMMGMPMHRGMGMPGMEMGGMEMMHEPMMMGVMARNPKMAGRMLQMRADIMRAVADVLTKYGKEMESGQWPAAQAEGGEGE